MELIVFDLDGTLLDRKSAVSGHTRETLQRLQQRGIAYTKSPFVYVFRKR